jgi:hypothetical protein
VAEPAAAADLWGKIVAFIREFGLPSFIVIWFLFRFEKKLEAFTNTLHKLLTVNVVMLKSLDKDDTALGLLHEDGEPDLVEEAEREITGQHPKKKKAEGKEGGR